MLQDFHAFPNPARFDCDVCIVGSGVAGLTLARRLAASGLDILLLESGGVDFERESQDLARGENAGFDYHALDEARLRFFGGTTAVWGGRCAQLDELDFERRAWLPHSGWPLARKDLAPWIAEAQRSLGIAELEQDEEARVRIGLPAAPFDPDHLRTTFWQFDDQVDRFALGRCGDWLAAGNLRILIHATVVNVRSHASGSGVDGVDIANLRGGRGRVHARATVLAAGGIENPRLLLASRDVHAAGLGNRHDWVGRCFMEHPHARGGRIVTRRPWRVMSLLRRTHHHDGQRYTALARAADALQQREEILNSAFTIAVRQHPEARMTLGRSAYEGLKHRIDPTRRGRGLWYAYRTASALVRESIGPAAGWLRVRSGGYGLYTVIRAEQAPNRESRVLLSETRDALGLPLPRLDWRLSPIDKRSVRVLMRSLDAELRRIGLGRLDPAPWLDRDDVPWESDPLISRHPIGGYHHMGTTRMASNPRAGVADPDGRVHGQANLYLAGSSLFPTSGWANPTLTLIALALRQADRIAAALQRPAPAPRPHGESGP